MTEFAVLVACAACVAIWVGIMRAREKAVHHAKRICAAEAVQLLDFTVALEKISFGRDSHGRAALRRIYHFEFSDTGNNRREGRVVLLGNVLESSYMEPHRFAPDLKIANQTWH
jgi:hypothetical protein